MANVKYNALRSLKGGVTANDPIDFDFDATAIDRSARSIKSSSRSLSGKTETLRDRTEVFWNITMKPLPEANIEDYRQFLDSVDGGETFTLDPYGTSAAPISPVACILESRSYTEKRQSHRYIGVSFRAYQK